MSMSSADRDTALLTAGALSARFVRNGDRWGHEIVLRNSDLDAVLLRSVEGLPEESWPASPPFTQLHIEERGGQPVVLFLGQAGDSMWSASVEADPLRSRLVFDVAARVSRLPTHLGSVYLAEMANVVRIDSQIAAFEFASHDVLIEAGSTSEVAGTLLPRTNDERMELLIAPAASHHPATVRWRYSIGVRPDANF